MGLNKLSNLFDLRFLKIKYNQLKRFPLRFILSIIVTKNYSFLNDLRTIEGGYDGFYYKI